MHPFGKSYLILILYLCSNLTYMCALSVNSAVKGVAKYIVSKCMKQWFLLWPYVRYCTIMTTYSALHVHHTIKWCSKNVLMKM